MMEKLTQEVKKIIDFMTLKITFVVWVTINILKLPDLIFMDVSSIKVVISKISHFIFLYLIISKIRKLWISRKQEKVKTEIIISLIFFTISFMTLLLVWPGTWSWDDVFIVDDAAKYNLTPWQHFFSGLFHILCMQTLPFNTGVIIIQILIASMIVGYSVTNIVDIMKIRNKKQKIIFMILLFIPCILPPVLEYLLGGFRMGIYSFLELLLITKLFIHYKKQEQINLKELIIISLLTIIVASWRTEAIYYVASLFIVFLLYGKQMISVKKTIVTTCVVGLSVIIIGKVNTHLIGNNNYSVTASIMPVSELVKVADKNEDKVALEQINGLIDISFIYENMDWTGEDYYWNGIVRNDYSKQDYSNYMKGYLSLALKYPHVTFKTMFNNFLNSTGVVVKYGKPNIRTAIVNTSGGPFYLFDLNSNIGKSWNNTNSIFKNTLNLKVRNSILRLIANIDKDDNVLPIYYFNWNLWIPLGLLIITMIILLIKKKWLLAFLSFTILARVILIFATSCAPYFMYYLSVYLVGYVYSITIIYMLIYEKRKIEV